MSEVQIAIIGGSGLYQLFEDAETREIDTPYGAPSAPVTLGRAGGRDVAFLPRHGRHHEIPPHAINSRANIWALRSLGVTRVIGPCAAGSLQANVHPGDVVVCDQLVDRTYGRAQTFYDGPEAVHVSWADPYCPQLRPIAADCVRTAGMPVHEKGTVVVVQGPRFSTRAESAWYRCAGWEVVNMTQYPEAYLARELEMCYVNLSVITDYDVGAGGQPGATPVTSQEALKVFAENLDRLRRALLAMVQAVGDERECPCGCALSGTPLRP